ncbi:Uncharacterised protein [Candidatus Gugararchaeum adminiculabundum]|nr:Uncharacterised protein [Candidatus Gugararchaeum adminiculabundum]
MSEDTMKKIGAWAFIGGVVLSLLVGIGAGFSNMAADTMGTMAIALAVLGLLVGALNITDKETDSFVIAAIGLNVGAIALANLGKWLVGNPSTVSFGAGITQAFTVFGIFVAGAVLIPALRSVYKLSKDE